MEGSSNNMLSRHLDSIEARINQLADQQEDLKYMAETTAQHVEQLKSYMQQTMDQVNKLTLKVKADNDEEAPASGKTEATVATNNDDDGGTVTQAMKDGLKRNIFVQPDDIQLDDIIGHDGPKKDLKEVFTHPFTKRFTYHSCNQPITTVLLYGPTGTGKTTLVHWAIKQAGKKIAFMKVLPCHLMSKFVGQMEQLLREVFRLAEENAPCVIFIDEIDFLIGDREGGKDHMLSMKALLLQELPPKHPGVFVVGATNYPKSLDVAFQRRFMKKILVGLPTQEDRLLQIRRLFSPTRNDLSKGDLKHLSQRASMMSQGQIRTFVAHIMANAARRVQQCPDYVAKDPRNKTLWMPCHPKYKGAVPIHVAFNDPTFMTYVESLQENIITKHDIDDTRATGRVSDSENNRYLDYEKSLALSKFK